MIDPDAIIAALRETDARSGGRREAWTPEWRKERERLDSLAGEVLIERDSFANTWYVLPGVREETVLVASHSDCVPGGGWLDGILGVHTGLALLRAAAAMTERTRTLVVVDWADEEGTRFGRSLLGSAAATGELTAAEFALLRTPAGEPAAAITEPYGFHADALGTPSARLGRVVAALELHIEQGPVLERSGRSVATVDGALGVRRFRLRFDGDTGHAGATPMDQRRDPVRTASDWVTQVMGLAESCGGLATVGQFTVEPSLPTVIARTAELSLDLRHRDLKSLDELAAAALSAAGDAAVEPLFSSDPTRFDQALVERALDLTQGPPLTSGPLHDSVSLARAGIPTVMMFAPSIGGISHARAEDTADADLRAAMTTFAALAASLLAGD